MRSTIRDDRGFSLSEMMVVIGLLSMVLGGAYGAMYYVTQTNTVSQAQGNAAHDFTDPVEEMSRLIMQNLSVRSATPYKIEVWTDRDMDGQPELDAFYATNDGKLVLERSAYTSDRLTVTSHSTWVMSEHNANVSAGIPLFQYYDGNGAEIPAADLATRAAGYTVRVRATVVVNMGGGATMSTVREIAFRTRS